MSSENITQSEVIKMLAIYERENSNLRNDYKNKEDDFSINLIFGSAPLVFAILSMIVVITLHSTGLIESERVTTTILSVLAVLSILLWLIPHPKNNKHDSNEEHDNNFDVMVSKQDFEVLSTLNRKARMSDDNLAYKEAGSDNVFIRFKDIEAIKERVKLISQHVKI